MNGIHRFVWVVAGLALLPACGGEKTPRGIRIRVITLPADGAPPGPLLADHHDLRSGAVRTHPLEPWPPGGEGVWIGKGAPSGHYEVRNAQGWRTLDASLQLPYLDADPSREPTPIAMARPWCIYLRPSWPSLPDLDPEWVLQRLRRGPAGEETWEDLDLEIVEHDHRWIGLRGKPGLWRAGDRLRGIGRFGDGQVARPAVVGVSTDPAHPYIRPIQPAESAPLRLALVDPQTFSPHPERVYASVEGMPDVVSWEGELTREGGVLSHVTSLGGALHLRIPGWSPGSVRLSDADWQCTHAIDLLPLAGDVVEVPLDGALAASVDAAWVWLEGRPAYGRAPLVQPTWAVTRPFDPGRSTPHSEPNAGGGPVPIRRKTVLYTQPGPQHWVLRAGSRWLAMQLDIAMESDPVVLGDGTEGVVVSGPIPQGHPGWTVHFRRRVGKGGAPVPFLRCDVMPGPAYRANLPAGTWEVLLTGPEIRGTTAGPFTWAPGTRTHLPLAP